MENIEKEKTIEDLSADTATPVEEAVDSVPDQEIKTEEAVETEEATEESAEEAVEEEKEAAAEEAAEEATEEAPTAKKALPIERDRLVSMILGGVGILFVIALFVRLFAFGLTADAFQYGLLKMNVWDTLKAGLGENVFGINNTLHFSLVLAMYIFPMLVAFGAGVTCLVRSLILILAKPKEKTKLTVPMIYSAAGIYALISYVALMNVLAGFCVEKGESFSALFAGALDLAIIAGIASLLQRVIRQATVERVMKANFYAKAEVTNEHLVRKEIVKNPTALTALVHKNVLFYVTFGLMAAAVIGLLSWFITMPVAAGVVDLSLKDFIKAFGDYHIDGFMDFLSMVAGIALMISLISSVCRLAFRAIDFLGTRLAFGASAQDRYEFAKFLGVFWRRLIYTIIFAAAFAALAPEEFEIGNIISAVLPYAVLMVICIVLRIVYAILACNLKYVTVSETVVEEVAEEATEEATEEAAEEAVEETAEEAAEEAAEEVVEEATEEATEEVAEEAVEEATEKAAEEALEEETEAE